MLHPGQGALRNEWVISVAGTVRPRGKDRENPKLPTGQIEVLGDSLDVLNRSDTVPFEPDEFTEVSEETHCTIATSTSGGLR